MLLLVVVLGLCLASAAVGGAFGYAVRDREWRS